jgi:hypothetical protein
VRGSWSLLGAPVEVEEVQVLVPVEGGDIVFAGAVVVGDVVGGGGVDGLVDGGVGGGGQALLAEEGVDAAGVYGGEELAVRVGPEV